LLRALSDGAARPSAGERRFRWLIAAALLIYLLIMYWRPVGGFFDLTPLTALQWGRVLPVACGAYFALWLSDALCHSL
jgi:hypothetical protein